jgi:hypothetical protein
MNTRKDEKIQLYRRIEKEVEGTTKTEFYRQFIYSQDKFMSGGLYANARDMKDSEIVSSGLQQKVENILFTVNRNPLIEEDLKVIYRGKVYDITPPIDNLDGRTVDIKFTAVRTTDTTKYAGVFNMDSARSIAGCNNDQKLAAIITPDAKPSITLSSFLLGDLNNTTVAAPNAVTNQVPSVAINAIMTKLFI